MFPNCCAVCIHPPIYVPQGVCVCVCMCMLSPRCECVCVCCVTRARASCCSVCINTLLGLSELSVNWVGESLCAARVSAALNFRPRSCSQTIGNTRTGCVNSDSCRLFKFPHVASLLPALTVPVEWLPGGKFALAGCGVARGGGGRSLAAAPSAVRWDPAPVPHLLLFLVVLLLQVLLLLGAPEVGHVVGQRRRTWVQRRLRGGRRS